MRNEVDWWEDLMQRWGYPELWMTELAASEFEKVAERNNFDCADASFVPEANCEIKIIPSNAVIALSRAEYMFEKYYKEVLELKVRSKQLGTNFPKFEGFYGCPVYYNEANDFMVPFLRLSLT
jgi:hypothetical protein